VQRADGSQAAVRALMNRLLSEHVLKPIPSNDRNPLLTPDRKNGLQPEGSRRSGCAEPDNAGTKPEMLCGSMPEVFLALS
jgi:hypothetical protein